LAEFDLIATDDLRQFGYYREAGHFQSTPTPYADLGEIVTGARPRRTSDEQRTMSINLGLALEDMVTAQRLYRMALDQGVGVTLPL
jgi:ornithine cyclodeaminase/alanine dehydrogenase-like protein (mu-crystallin family)